MIEIKITEDGKRNLRSWIEHDVTVYLDSHSHVSNEVCDLWLDFYSIDDLKMFLSWRNVLLVSYFENNHLSHDELYSILKDPRTSIIVVSMYSFVENSSQYS